MARNRVREIEHETLMLQELGLRKTSQGKVFLANDAFIVSPFVENQYNRFDLNASIAEIRKDYHTRKGYLLFWFFGNLLMANWDSFMKAKTLPARDKYRYTVYDNGGLYIIRNHTDKSEVTAKKVSFSQVSG